MKKIMKQIVSVKECSEYNVDEIEKNLRQSFDEIEKKFKKDSVFLIKPSILLPAPPEKAITTHPDVVEAVVRIIKPYAKRIIIGESSGHSTNKGFKESGIRKLVSKAEIEIMNFSDSEKKEVEILGSKYFIPKIIFDCDYMISIGKLKTHILTNVTLATKNLYGCIPGNTKTELHKKYPDQANFSKFLIELKNTIKPSINIIDGIIGMEGNGPGTSGTIKKSGVLITGTSAYSVDSVCAKIMGFKEKEIPTLFLDDREEYEVKGKVINQNFKKPNNNIKNMFFLFKYFPPGKIIFDRERCIKCKRCEEKCPGHAIDIDKKKWDKKKCIFCMCCIEICPERAIKHKEFFLKRFGGWVLKKLPSKK